MSLFKCEECGCAENTATSNYWWIIRDRCKGKEVKLLCSECDPAIGRWHGIFPKKSAVEYVLGSDGYLYSVEEVSKERIAQGLRTLGSSSGLRFEVEKDAS